MFLELPLRSEDDIPARSVDSGAVDPVALIGEILQSCGEGESISRFPATAQSPDDVAGSPAGWDALRKPPLAGGWKWLLNQSADAVVARDDWWK